MRLISQNKQHDVPYEGIILTRYGRMIQAETPNENEVSYKMGVYSTEEKAEKVMKMCWMKQAKNVFASVFEFPTEYELEKIEELDAEAKKRAELSREAREWLK